MDKAFEKGFNKLCYARSPYAVWRDFVCLFATAIANATDYSQEREAQYLDIAQKYSKAELELFISLAQATICALEDNPQQDYLGELFMGLKLGNTKAGQYFTPYHIAEMMSHMTIPNSSERPYITIHDPTCGSGVMMIAAYNCLARRCESPAIESFMVGQDIDHDIALMCYIQLSLLGIPGYVVIGNSLTAPQIGNPIFAPPGAWCTPLYYHSVWEMRRTIKKAEALFGEGL